MTPDEKSSERVGLTMGAGAIRAGVWIQGKARKRPAFREVLEETGLDVRLTRLVGVYTSPDLVIENADGYRIKPVKFSFEAQVVGGVLRVSDETTAYGYFSH